MTDKKKKNSNSIKLRGKKRHFEKKRQVGLRPTTTFLATKHIVTVQSYVLLPSKIAWAKSSHSNRNLCNQEF